MTKTQSRSRTRAPVGKQARGKRKPRKSFYQRNSRQLVLGGLGLLVVLVFLMTRGGSSEDSSGTSAFTGGDFHSLIADPQNPGRIFAGGHQAVAVSNDGGGTWKQVDSLEDADAMGWGMDQNAVYLGGHPGLSVSSDGGKTFSQKNDGLPATDLHSLGAGGGVLYAGSPAGLLASTDGANSWQIRNPQGARSFMGRILVEPGRPEHLIAPDMASGVVESNDGGRSWKSLGGLDSAQWVSWDPANVARIVASGGGAAVQTRDGGQTWSGIDLPAGTTIVEVDPTDSEVLYAGAHDGERVSVQVSRDGGDSWQNP